MDQALYKSLISQKFVEKLLLHITNEETDTQSLRTFQSHTECDSINKLNLYSYLFLFPMFHINSKSTHS